MEGGWWAEGHEIGLANGPPPGVEQTYLLGNRK